jgi:TolB protein
MIVDVEGGSTELLALVPPPRNAHSLTWSPDGNWIAFVNGNSLFVTPGVLGNVASSSIWMVRVEDGEMVRITTDDDLNVSPAWLPDSRHLLFVSDREGPRDAFAVRVGARGAVGEVQRLGIPAPYSIAVSADGSKLTYARFSFNRNIRSYPLGQRAPVSVAAGTRVTTGSQVVENHDISSDGEWLLYDSNLNGNQDIFRRRLTGGPVIPVTTGPTDEFSPDLSPDGTEVAYHSIRDGRRRVFVRSIDGGPETEISGEHRATYPQWSPNGLQIVYSGNAGAHLVTRDRVGEPWGEPQLLPWPPAFIMGEWVPDGSAVAFSDGRSIWMGTPEGGLRRLVATEGNGTDPRALAAVGRPRVSRDGSTVFFEGVDGERNQGVWSVPATDGQACVMGDDDVPACDNAPLAAPRLVVEFDSPSLVLYSAAVSVSSDRVYLSIAEYESDIYVMDLEY